jgi:hypothetical protein
VGSIIPEECRARRYRVNPRWRVNGRLLCFREANSTHRGAEMGWKGTLRSISAASRAIEREARRRQRELERQRAQIEKMQELERAAYEVQVFENYIDVLLSIHKDCGQPWDWEAIHLSSPPMEPRRSDAREVAAQAQLDAFKPGVRDKLLRRVESKQEKHVHAVEWAKEEDERQYQEAVRAYDQDYADWESTRQLAARLLAGEPAAFEEAIVQTNPFGEISGLGSSIVFTAGDSSTIEVNLGVNDEEVIPRESKSLLKSGKLSVKPMTKTRFWELYQDYVCGCVLRVARELFVLLPLEMAIVNAVGRVLNTQTGHLESQPILSVALPRATLEDLNFEMLDPSDSMSNFVHRMAFRKLKGFQAITPLTPSDVQTEG